MDPYENEAVPNGDNKDANSSYQTQEENDSKSHSRSRDEEDVSGKIFVGGLARETTSAEFVKHFSKYGEITDSVIMKDRSTGQPRGFGFVTYADPYVVDKVLEDTHIIFGKQVEIKKTIPRGSMGANDFKTKKIFVGGIPATVTEDEFKTFFMQFGEVREQQIMLDHTTSRSRGFGFITFESEKAVDDLLVNGNRLELAGAQVEIKKAEPKKPNQPPARSSKRYSDSRSSFDGGFGDAYGGYGGRGGSTGGYRSDSAYGANRAGAYGGYDGGEFSGYGGYGGSGGGMGPYRGEPPLAYSSRYGAGFNRGYDMGGAYGGLGDFYSGGYGGSAGPGGAGAGYGSGYHMGLGGGYGGSGGSSMYGSRGGYGGSGAGGGGGAGASSSRYHPYQR